MTHSVPILAARLTAQLLAGPAATDPQAVAERLLAVQAQDPMGFRLAVRARTEGVTAADVDRALTEERRPALIAKRDAYQAMFKRMIRDGIRDGSLRASDTAVATYAILLQCTGVALWFDPRGSLDLEEVAELHVELVLGSLQASPELIAEAIEGVSRQPVGAEAG